MATKNSDLKNWIESKFWFWVFVVVLVVCLIIYIVNAIVSEIQPYNIWGLSYGTAAAVLVVAATLFGLRRRIMKTATKFGLGKSQAWLQLHIYGGTLFLLLTFMHSGFRMPSGTLAWWLWFLSIWITLSGILGAVLEKWIPTILTSGLAIEVLYDRIPELISEIREKVERLIQTCDDPIRDFYRKNLAASLAGPEQRLIYYMDITGGIQSQIKHFDYLRRFLPAAEKEKLDQLETIYKTKLEIDAHYTLQKALRWWLYLHVPVSFVLILLLGLHLYSVLYY